MEKKVIIKYINAKQFDIKKIILQKLIILRLHLNKYYGYLLLGILTYFSVNSLLGKVSFGAGIADIFFIIILLITTFIYLIAFLINHNKSKRLLITNLLSIPGFWLILSATIWRGSVFPWNGEIFFIPCRSEIRIDNGKQKIQETLSMCSMVHHSVFRGIWNGKEIEKVSGNIKIPEKLKKHLNYPIEKVFIEPVCLNRLENEVVKKVPLYNLDTLKIGSEYEISGEICKILNRKPIIQGRIK